MKTSRKLSSKILRKIVFISVILVCILGVGVMAARSDNNLVTIVFADECTTTVMTSKVQVSEILEENHIILLDNEVVTPSLDSNIDVTKTIKIQKASEKKVIAEEISSVSTEELLGKYVTITEKIIVEQVEIPYETITKDVSASGTQTKDRVLQEGENGLKEIKYKVKYQDDKEIERVVISEETIKEPVNKIIQISTKVSSRSGFRTNGVSLSTSVEGMTPTVVTLNASAYTASTCGKSSADSNYGRTASGAIASSWYTVAAGSGYPMGTVIYIPYFANKENGGWFVVQDRGGAITNNRIDIYMDTIGECQSFGRRNLECYIYY